MSGIIQYKRGTASEWTTANPVLAEGEPGYDETTNTIRVGDGVKTWSALAPTAAPQSFTNLDLVAGSDPGPSSPGHMTMYAKAVAGRVLPKVVGPSGLDTYLQPFMARNKIGIWVPPGNANTAPGVFGYTPITAVGTATARTVATTNMFTRMRRLGYVSATTAGSLVSVRVPIGQVTTGTGSLGGFHKIMRFGISDAAAVAGARMFMGMSVNVAAPTNVEPSTLANCIGIGHGAADTNMKLFYGGSAAQTPIDLGANFPINGLNTDVYDLSLFSSPNGAGEIYWEVQRLNTGHVASGVVSPAGGVALPGATSLMTYLWGYRCNNATALAVGVDLMGDYIETDY